MDAAAALGDMAAMRVPRSNDVNAEMPASAASALTRVFRAARVDPDTGSHLPLHFQDIAEQEVVQAVAAALARARTADGLSPDSVVDLLLGALKSVDNRSIEFNAVGAS
jgi:malic enzyme